MNVAFVGAEAFVCRHGGRAVLRALYELLEPVLEPVEMAVPVATAATPPGNSEPEPEPEPSRPDAERLWQATLDRLRQQVSRPNFDTWLRDSEAVRIDTGGASPVLLVRVQSEHQLVWLETRLAQLVRQMAAAAAGKEILVAFIVEKSPMGVLRFQEPGAAIDVRLTMRWRWRWRWRLRPELYNPAGALRRLLEAGGGPPR